MNLLSIAMEIDVANPEAAGGEDAPAKSPRGRAGGRARSTASRHWKRPCSCSGGRASRPRP
ncbi:hypothetical protein [Lysobacter gummosus]|uniref:hypothetical protein n=1 Tax=Lysobacter gummosus TaxID=262324 RepID=UPI003636C18A